MESMVDSNNNAASGKYSLRPRNAVKRSQERPEEDEVFKTCRQSRRSSQRGMSLSKYRRKSANARERCRMREINAAFEALRRVVGWPSDNQGEKATKISTLRLAMRHITALSEALQETATSSGEGHQGGLGDGVLYDSDLSVGEFVIQEHPMLISPAFNSLANEPQLSKISSLSLQNQSPRDFRNRYSGIQTVINSIAIEPSALEASSLIYNVPTRYPSTTPNVVSETQCDRFCDNQILNSKSDLKVQILSSDPLSSSSFPTGPESTLSHTDFLGPSLQHTQAATPALEDSSTLLSEDMDTHVLHPISFEELFIT